MNSRTLARKRFPQRFLQPVFGRFFLKSAIATFRPTGLGDPSVKTEVTQ